MNKVFKKENKPWEESLKDKVIVISGSSSGLGENLSKYFLNLGSKLSLFSRNISSSSLVNKWYKKENILFDDVDTTKIDEVNLFINKTICKYGKIDCLINCAGSYGPMSPFIKTDPQKFTDTINTNLIGSFNTIHTCLPIFIKEKYGRIVQLSGGGATSPLPYIYGYAASKAAVVRMIESLAFELEDIKNVDIKINAVAPGALNTQMLDQVINAGVNSVGKRFYEKALKQKNEGGDSIQNATECIAYLVSELNTKISSKLISAVWDPWREWAQLSSSEIIPNINDDIYTLRRLVK